MSCQNCTTPDGRNMFPHYGVAPHVCFYKIPGATIGQSRVLPREEWPSNFEEDPEVPGCGMYTHCLTCGGAS